MSFEETSVEELTEVFLQLKKDVLLKLSENQKKFLLSFAKGEPDFSLSPFVNLKEFPAIKWKLQNLIIFKTKSPNAFNLQVKNLEDLF